MENFEKISGYVNDIDDCSRSITYSTEDLKPFLMGFLVNSWLSEDIKSQLKNLKDSSN